MLIKCDSPYFDQFHMPVCREVEVSRLALGRSSQFYCILVSGLLDPTF